ncbi:MAG: ATP-binding protein [Desulfuromonadaceae bacterium]|nr:ATP-binding protein [Desulfuromonas sp.]MDY0185838.1 ATP-binding protein [Desulfuromonadaceae bacterium]
MSVLNATQIRTRVTILFVVTILSIGLIVSAVAFGILLRTYMATSAEQYRQHLKSKQTALGNCLQHLTEQAIQMHSCNTCCTLLDSYCDNPACMETLQHDNIKTLAHALKHSRMIDGIVRIDLDGKVIANVGSTFPSTFWPYAPGTTPDGSGAPVSVVYSGLISEEGQLHLIAVSSITLETKIIGYDILFFSPIHFLDILQDSSVAATALFHPDYPAIIWADGTYSSTRYSADGQHAKVEKIISTLDLHQDTEAVQSWPTTFDAGQPNFIYARIPGSTWYIGSYIDKPQTFWIMLREHIAILLTTLGLSFVGGILCYLALRPLTRRIITLASRLELANVNLEEKVHERRLVEADLHLSEEQWVNTFTSIEDAIFVLDADGKIIKQNSAARNLSSAYPGAKYTGTLIPRHGERSELFKKMQAQKTSIKQVFDAPADTSFSITLTPIIINQQITGAVHLVRDITDEIRGEKVKSEMLAAVSHEIRTPITAIMGFVEFMQTTEVTAEQRQEYLQIIQREMNRMSELMNDFLDLQRLQSSMQEYNFSEANLAELLRESAELYAMTLHKHSLVMQVPEHLPSIKVDAERMLRVFSNLISNAIKYSPKGGAITIGARSTPRSIFVWIQDEGFGIPPQSQTKIFNRFYRVNDGDRRIAGGLGLGLALVKEIVEAHKGKVWVESKEDQGSTFFVELPRD